MKNQIISIKHWREKLGCKTQQELADLLKVKREAVTMWENGVHDVPPYIVQSLKFLGNLQAVVCRYHETGWDGYKKTL